jgi:hypothetical protein
MIENDHVVIVNGKEIARLMSLETTVTPPGNYIGEWRESFLKVGVVGYYKGKVVIHSEEV